MPINAFRFGHMPNSVEKKTPNKLENYTERFADALEIRLSAHRNISKS
jgi:hypothetical protein